MVVRILPGESSSPVGKLADAELLFEDGILAGLKLVGFSIWDRRAGGARSVTFPARSFAVNGERRSFALLRPIGDTAAQEPIRALVLEAFAQFETQRAQAETLPLSQAGDQRPLTT
jgi:hypothetical protein